jgi:hypothetical protein
VSGGFAQGFCSVAPCGAQGRVITGRRLANCQVRIGDDGELVLSHASTVVARAPAAGVQIVTPPGIRRIGTAVILLVDSRVLAVEFDSVYRRQRESLRTGSRAGRVLRSVFGLPNVSRGMRVGRTLARQFAAALTAAGAADRATA